MQETKYKIQFFLLLLLIIFTFLEKWKIIINYVSKHCQIYKLSLTESIHYNIANF